MHRLLVVSGLRDRYDARVSDAATTRTGSHSFAALFWRTQLAVPQQELAELANVARNTVMRPTTPALENGAALACRATASSCALTSQPATLGALRRDLAS